jgi:argininosuccinate lyase
MVEKFTIGNDSDLDLALVLYDVQASIAHAKMLCSIGLLSEQELEQLLTAFNRIENMYHAGKFIIEPGVEDVHSQLEILLTRFCGETGKKIHTGRSRNDQVLTALKLFLKHELDLLISNVNHTISVFEIKANATRGIFMPGYTHFQLAMPSDFGMWISAYAELLKEDLLLLNAAHTLADRNPLGSAAGYGSNLPLNSRLTADLMGFAENIENPIAAQCGRGKIEKQSLWAIAAVAATVSKFATDACLFMCDNFDFISFPNELTTGSSIMPHKKNPDVFEIIRGKCNILKGYPYQLDMLMCNLPHGYHRDFQLTKEFAIPAFTRINECLTMLDVMVEAMKVNENLIKNEMYQRVFSVNKVNELVLKGYSFRDAYREVSESLNMT